MADTSATPLFEDAVVALRAGPVALLTYVGYTDPPYQLVSVEGATPWHAMMISDQWARTDMLLPEKPQESGGVFSSLVQKITGNIKGEEAKAKVNEALQAIMGRVTDHIVPMVMFDGTVRYAVQPTLSVAVIASIMGRAETWALRFDANGRTPLHIAAASCDDRMIKNRAYGPAAHAALATLIAHLGPDVRGRLDHDEPPLRAAVRGMSAAATEDGGHAALQPGTLRSVTLHSLVVAGADVCGALYDDGNGVAWRPRPPRLEDADAGAAVPALEVALRAKRIRVMRTSERGERANGDMEELADQLQMSKAAPAAEAKVKIIANVLAADGVDALESTNERPYGLTQVLARRLAANPADNAVAGALLSALKAGVSPLGRARLGFRVAPDFLSLEQLAALYRPEQPPAK